MRAGPIIGRVWEGQREGRRQGAGAAWRRRGAGAAPGGGGRADWAVRGLGACPDEGPGGHVGCEDLRPGRIHADVHEKGAQHQVRGEHRVNADLDPENDAVPVLAVKRQAGGRDEDDEERENHQQPGPPHKRAAGGRDRAQQPRQAGRPPPTRRRRRAIHQRHAARLRAPVARLGLVALEHGHAGSQVDVPLLRRRWECHERPGGGGCKKEIDMSLPSTAPDTSGGPPSGLRSSCREHSCRRRCAHPLRALSPRT